MRKKSPMELKRDQAFRDAVFLQMRPWWMSQAERMRQLRKRKERCP